MTNKQKTSLALIILWVIVGGCDIASAFLGSQPSWWHVFPPLLCLLVELFDNLIE